MVFDTNRLEPARESIFRGSRTRAPNLRLQEPELRLQEPELWLHEARRHRNRRLFQALGVLLVLCADFIDKLGICGEELA